MLNKKGFTLIELMVVIVIIGVLAALAIPRFINASVKAKFSEAPLVIKTYETAQLANVAETGALGAMNNLVFDRPTTSRWWIYGGTGTIGTAAAGLALTDGVAIAAASTALGDFGQNATLTSTITAASVITHTNSDADYVKYAPLWQ